MQTTAKAVDFITNRVNSMKLCDFITPQGNFPTQELNPCLLHPALAGVFFTTSTTWEALILLPV